MLVLTLFSIPLIAIILSLPVNKNIKWLNVVAITATIAELAVSIQTFLYITADNKSYQNASHFFVDSLGCLILLILTVVGLMVVLFSVAYFKEELKKNIIGFRRVKQYFVLLHVFFLAMFFAITTTSPILMWVAVEATTLSTVFLVSFYNRSTSVEAAWKYFVINSIGLLLNFFGTLLFLYPAMSTGHGGLIDWDTVTSLAKNFDPTIVKIAFIMVVVGYGTKAGFVPMHTWLPDAHSKAPSPISALLSGVLLNVAFLAILRFKLLTDLAIGKTFSQEIFIVLGLLSILVPAFIILSQINYKRLLAYSSIEHMGIVALGFGFGGTGAFAALLHMIYHSLTKSLLFLSAGNIFLRYESTKTENVKGVLKVMPITGLLFLLGFLSITGVPPFGTFLTEFLILSSGIAVHPLVVSLSIVGLAIIFIGFMRIVTSMLFGTTKKNIHTDMPMSNILPIVGLMIILIVTSLYLPENIINLIKSAALNF